MQTDQQHSTSCVPICWLMVAWAARCCAMLRLWFDFRIFIQVSNGTYCSSFKLYEPQTIGLSRVHCNCVFRSSGMWHHVTGLSISWCLVGPCSLHHQRLRGMTLVLTLVHKPFIKCTGSNYKVDKQSNFSGSWLQLNLALTFITLYLSELTHNSQWRHHLHFT